MVNATGIVITGINQQYNNDGIVLSMKRNGDSIDQSLSYFLGIMVPWNDE
jgi:hypothetical protein